jgi:uncharacterized protein YjeT (DUF2065 family)
MLKVLTIIIGLLVIITRGLGVLSLAKMKSFVAVITSSASRIRVLGVFVLILGVLIFIALGRDWTGARLLMGLLGILWLVASVVLIVLPEKYRALVDWFMKLPDLTLRILFGFGVAFGVLLLILGIAYY